MNRIEFMTELAALLQDVPVEERREAMQYYNDYFDDAGEENEEQVISELGSPAKVAATIKADLGSQAGDYAEYSENGYTDSRFDQKEMPAGRDYQRKEEKEPPKTSRALKIVLIIAIILVGAPVLIPLGVGITLNEEQVISELGSPAKVAATIKADLGSQAGDYAEYSENGYTDSRFDQKEMPAGRDYQRKEEKEPPKTSRALKIVLIIAIILVGAPVLIPLGVGITLAVLGCIIALFCAFIALVIASVAVAIAGIVVFCVGIATLIPELAVGLALVGTGLILTVLGVIATVASVKLCLVVFPGICRGIVWICRRPFQGKAVA